MAGCRLEGSHLCCLVASYECFEFENMRMVMDPMWRRHKGSGGVSLEQLVWVWCYGLGWSEYCKWKSWWHHKNDHEKSTVGVFFWSARACVDQQFGWLHEVTDTRWCCKPMIKLGKFNEGSCQLCLWVRSSNRHQNVTLVTCNMRMTVVSLQGVVLSNDGMHIASY